MSVTSQQLPRPFSKPSDTLVMTKKEEQEEKKKRKKEKRRKKQSEVLDSVSRFWAEHYIQSLERTLPASDIFGFYQTIATKFVLKEEHFNNISGQIGFSIMKGSGKRGVKRYRITWRSDACKKYHMEHSASSLAWEHHAEFSPSFLALKNKKVRCTHRRRGCSWQGVLSELRSHSDKCKYQNMPIALLSSKWRQEFDDKYGDFERSLEDLASQLTSLNESHLKSIDLRNEEQLEEQLQYNQLVQGTKLLRERNAQLLEEVTFLLKEEREQRELQMQLSVLDGLKLTIVTLQNEMASLKENGVLLDPAVTPRSNKTLATLSKGSCKTVSSMNSEPLGNQMGESNNPFEKNGCIELGNIKAEVKDEIDFEFNQNDEQNLEQSMSYCRAIAVTHHSGDPRYKRIVNRKVEFGPLSTISAPYAVVPPRAKSWYEVRYVSRGFGSDAGVQRVGWCSSRLPRTRMYTNRAVGDDLESYSFDPFHGHKYNGSKSVWGEYFEGEGVGYVGVALDMINGEISFSLNGVWEEPMGVAFNKLPRDARLFPAISGCDVTIEVNFGEQEFVYGPPDGTYVPLNSV